MRQKSAFQKNERLGGAAKPFGFKKDRAFVRFAQLR
jgi:hypothetical protein